MCPLEAGIKLNETFVEPKVFKCLLSIFFNEKILIQVFLDALASLDFKLSLSDSPFFTASASTGLSDLSQVFFILFQFLSISLNVQR